MLAGSVGDAGTGRLWERSPPGDQHQNGPDAAVRGRSNIEVWARTKPTSRSSQPLLILRDEIDNNLRPAACVALDDCNVLNRQPPTSLESSLDTELLAGCARARQLGQRFRLPLPRLHRIRDPRPAFDGCHGQE